MNNICAVKTAHYMHQGIAFANVAQKLVAKPLAFRGAFYKAGNINEFYNGRRFFVGLPYFGQLVQPCVRHGHHADIGFDGAERVICRPRPGVGDGIEQSGFAHVGKPQNAQFHNIVPLFR